jgi:ribose-phosphate pyrophosphokinase
MAMAAAAAAGLAASSGGVALCEREGAVRDPKTVYGVHADNVMKMELRRLTPERQPHDPSVKVLEPVVEDAPEPKAVESPAVVIKATSPAPPAAPAPANPSAEESTLMTPEEARLEAATLKAKKHGGGLKLFSGNGNLGLSIEIAKLLGVNLGRATVSSFADGEIHVQVHENVRGKDVYIIQPTCPPVNNNLMELLLMVSCLNRASARRVTVVIPYYGYARQDRKMQARVPISAADVARLLESMGVDRVIAVDLHCGQIQGFFGPRVPVDNLEGGIVGIDHFGGKDLHNPVIVSPDAGGVYRAKKFKEGLAYKYGLEDIGIAMIIKQRARAGSVDSMDLVGDVKDCDCIIVDDMIDTAGTLCAAADVLVAQGARRVFAFATHGLLSGPGNERIANSALEECVILNTIPTTPQRLANEKLVELSVAPLLAQTIFNIHAKRSISALFK